MNVGQSAAVCIFGFAVWSGAAAMAQENGAKAEEAGVHYLSKQSLGKGITTAQLSNGMTVIVQENHAAPLATVRCYVKNTGSVYEGKWLGAGLSHLVEHLVAGGSNKRSEDEIQALIDSLGGQSNAYTSNNVTAYHIDAPAKKTPLAIELVADMMQYAAFKDEEYQREMGVVQRELEMGEAERNRVMYAAMKALIFTEHPMRLPTIGYLPVLQKISRQDVVDFYKSRYVPQNMVFVVVGDVKTDDTLKEVAQNFKTFERTTERAPALVDEPDQASPRQSHLEMEGKTTHFAIAWPTVMLQHPDLYPLDVASYLLTNGDSSRLVKRLQIEKPLAISVSASSFTPGYVKGWFEITVECEPENVETCRKIVMEEIERLKTEPVSAPELAKVMRQKSADHVFGLQTVQAQAETLGGMFLATGDPLFDDQYVEGIKSVTAAQIQATAKHYFRPERQNYLQVNPIGSSEKQNHDTVAEDVESPVLKKKLSNGLTVLLKRNAVVPMVSVQAFVQAGVLSEDAATSGRASLTADLMDKGTQKYTGAEIAEYFDSLGGSLSVGSQRNTSFLQAQVLKDDFEPSLDYIHQVLFKPTFPQDEFKKVQQLQLGQIAARAANPQTQILDYWTSLLPAASPYSRTPQGTPESVSKLTAADCQKFHKQYFVPNNMVIAVFGDIDVEKTLAQMEQKFGKEAGSPSFKMPTYAALPAPEGQQLHNLPSRREDTAMVVLGYPTVPITDTKTHSALEVMSSLLTDSGGRMFNELRGAQLVYYVFGFQLSGPAPGYFVFMAQTRPVTKDEVIARIQAALAKVRKEGIPEDELNSVKQKLQASHAMSNTTASQQAFQAALYEIYGLGYDYEKSYDDRIQAVTSADIQAVVEKFFQHATIATSSPEKNTASK